MNNKETDGYSFKDFVVDFKKFFMKYKEFILGLFIEILFEYLAITIDIFKWRENVGEGIGFLLYILVGVIIFIVSYIIYSVAKSYWNRTGGRISFGFLISLIFVSPIVILIAVPTIYLQSKASQGKTTQIVNISNTVSALGSVVLDAEETNSALMTTIADIQGTKSALSIALGDAQATQTAQIKALNNSYATQSLQSETLAAVQATLAKIEILASLSLASDEEIKNVLRDYIESLSSNRIDIAWKNLTPRLQKSIIDKQGRNSYEKWWEARIVQIVEFIKLDFIFDRTGCWVDIRVVYYKDDYPTEYHIRSYVKENEELGVWLIDTWSESEISGI